MAPQHSKKDANTPTEAENSAAPAKAPSKKSLEHRRPEIIDELIYRLADPLRTEAKTQIAEKYAIEAEDLYRFERRNRHRVEALKAKLIAGEWDNISQHFKVLAYQAVQRAREALPKASAKDAAIISQVATDKVLLLENKGVRQVSVIHEHRHSVAGVLESLVREMKARGIPMPTKIVGAKLLPPSSGDEPSNTPTPEELDNIVG